MLQACLLEADRPAGASHLFTASGPETAALRSIVGPALDALSAAGVRTIVASGTVAQYTHGDPLPPQHHDLELLVALPRVARAVEALRPAGLESIEPMRAGLQHLRHRTGRTIVLRTRLFEPEVYPSGWDWYAARAVSSTVAGRRALVLTPADALHQACVHASYGPGRNSLQWIADVDALLRASASDEDQRIDWNGFFESVDHSSSSIPVLVVLDYFASRLGAAVPPEVLGRLDARTQFATRLERDTALREAWRGQRNRLGAALSDLKWMDRLVVLGWLLFPSRPLTVGGRAHTSRVPAVGYANRLFRHSLRLLSAQR